MKHWDRNRGDWVWDVQAVPPTEIVIDIAALFPRDVQYEMQPAPPTLTLPESDSRVRFIRRKP